MDLKNTALKFFNSEENPETYNGPYVVRPGQLDILVRTLMLTKIPSVTRTSFWMGAR